VQSKFEESGVLLSKSFGRHWENQKQIRLAIDGTIQRFEFVIELFWKTLRRLLAEEGIQTDTPREALQQAFQIRWLRDEAAWLQMLKDRNETSHVYDELAARRIYERIKRYRGELEATDTYLQKRFGGPL